MKRRRWRRRCTLSNPRGKTGEFPSDCCSGLICPAGGGACEVEKM